MILNLISISVLIIWLLAETIAKVSDVLAARRFEREFDDDAR